MVTIRLSACPRAGELVQAELDWLLRATEPQSIPEEGPREAKIGRGHSDLIRLSARKPGDSQRVAESKTLVDLGIYIGFEPIPQAQAGV